MDQIREPLYIGRCQAESADIGGTALAKVSYFPIRTGDEPEAGAFEVRCTKQCPFRSKSSLAEFSGFLEYATIGRGL